MVSPLVFRDTFFKEIGFPLERYHFHEIERVGGVVVLHVPQRDKKAIGDKLNVLTHEFRVHSD